MAEELSVSYERPPRRMSRMHSGISVSCVNSAPFFGPSHSFYTHTL